MSKHRSPGRRGAQPVAFTMAAAVALALVVTVLALWPPDRPATAAGQRMPPADASEVQKTLPGLKRLVVYGHSMPTGGGASDPSLGYAQVAAETTGLRLVQRAEGGTMAATAATTMEASPLAGPRDVVVIHTGMNDVFRRGDEAVDLGREGVQRLLAGAAGAGRRVVVLECQPPSWEHTPPGADLQAAYDAWNAMLREEAAVVTGVDVLDTCAEWVPESYTDAPKYHPNDGGHAQLAVELVALLTTS